MKLLLSLISFISLIQATVVAVETIYCNETVACPESMPCCSISGVCGVGENCLGSCNPAFSFSKDACMPVPICKNISTNFNKYSDKLTHTYTYLGNVSETDWTYSGYVMDYEDEESLILAMPKNTTGSVLSSTRYMWYGKYSVRMRTSHMPGVITAIVLYSQVKDEIDYEFVGANLTTAQTNFYWQGLLNYTNSGNISTTDTFEDFHTYEVDWQEDVITWSIDGVVGRRLFKNETYNSTSGTYLYPQTPCRVQISIWSGGAESQAQGTIEWAGGAIDWDAPDIKDPGYYYMMVSDANITCYDPPSVAKVNGSTAYKFISEKSFLEKDVAIVDADLMLDNYEDTGLSMRNKTKSGKSSLSSSLSSSSTSTSSKNSKGSSTTTDASKSTSTTSITDEQKTKFFQNLTSTVTSKAGAIVLLTNNWLTLMLGFIVTYII